MLEVAEPKPLVKAEEPSGKVEEVKPADGKKRTPETGRQVFEVLRVNTPFVWVHNPPMCCESLLSWSQ